MTAKIDVAENPTLNRTRSTLRPLTNRESMRRAKAIAHNSKAGTTLACTGQIFIGIFFDGTGNNEQADFIAAGGAPQKYKHSNVVRLSHAYPDDETRGTTRYFNYYVPGVGTPFPEIFDTGGKLGTGASWNGEPRLIWGLTRVFNAVSNFVSNKDLIPTELAGKIAKATGGIGSTALHREHVFGVTWQNRLKKVIAEKPKSFPLPEQINLSVFGFSRGAAEARAFVNWLYAICEKTAEGYQFAGIPIRVDFLGIFDTVASVGLAGGFSSGLLGVEGRQSWASDNMQIHPGVESCLHIVAAHEVRATFPMDSVRIDGTYPANVKEQVYPGAHSDVGGGYSTSAQGKTDALARIAGFEMYCAALAAGVPFKPLAEMSPRTRNALIPSQAALTAFNTYMQACGVKPAPVEDMMRAHMGHYFTYRYQARRKPYSHAVAQAYYARPFFRKAKEQEFLRDSQQHFTAVLAAASAHMERRMSGRDAVDSYLEQPYQATGGVIDGFMGGYASLMGMRINVLRDSLDIGDMDAAAQGIGARVARWKKWLSENGYPLLRDADSPERDLLSVLETISDAPQQAALYDFFDQWVHDSMAGLASDGVNEFLLNGIGMSKFRRVYFGNRGDAMLRERAEKANEDQRMAARQRARGRAVSHS